MTFHHKFAIALTLALTNPGAKADPIVYAFGDSGQFGTVNLSTGAFTSIGPGLPVATGGLVQGSNGNLLTLGFEGNLYSINPATGGVSTVGATGLGDCTLPSSPCGPNSASILGKVGSKVYAVDIANNLYALNEGTGTSTLIGATGIPALPFIPHAAVPGDSDGSFYIYDETLFSYGGNLYANFDDGIFDPVTFTPTPLTAPTLYRIDVTTGVAIALSPTDFGLAGITDLSGTLYAFSLPTSSVVTLDLTNGSTSYVADTDPAVGLIVGATPVPPVPEPESLVLVGTGLAALAGGVRRRGGV